MNRIDNRLNNLKKEGKKAFITYITAGLPDMEGTMRILKEQFEAGVDVAQLGIPFSDPVADGPIIQTASYHAIQNGVNLRKCFDMVSKLREDCELPIVFLAYFNTILHYGIEAFAKKCNEAGVDGVIVPDLPYEEQYELREALEKEGDATYIIQLVGPTSGKRIEKVLKDAKGFVYCLSQMGVTGQTAEFHSDLNGYLCKIKEVTDIPVMLGYGIHTPEDVNPYADTTDGAIVGSMFIKTLEKNNYSDEAVSEFVKNFKENLK